MLKTKIDHMGKLEIEKQWKEETNPKLA